MKQNSQRLSLRGPMALILSVYGADLILCFDRLTNHKAYDMCNPSGLTSRSVTITN